MRVTADDYEPLKAFFMWIQEPLFGPLTHLAPELRPTAQLESTEAQSKVRARQGLGMAIGDIVEMTDRISPEELAAIDAGLSAAGLWTLTMVRARFGRAVRGILKRGMVRDEPEYYALRSAVGAMPEAERDEAWRLLGAFETRIGEKRA